MNAPFLSIYHDLSQALALKREGVLLVGRGCEGDGFRGDVEHAIRGGELGVGSQHKAGGLGHVGPLLTTAWGIGAAGVFALDALVQDISDECSQPDISSRSVVVTDSSLQLITGVIGKAGVRSDGHRGIRTRIVCCAGSGADVPRLFHVTSTIASTRAVPDISTGTATRVTQGT